VSSSEWQNKVLLAISQEISRKGPRHLANFTMSEDYIDDQAVEGG